MEDENWREETLKKLTQILRLDNQVLSLSLFGSLSNANINKDKWSDLDILLVVEDTVLAKYSSPDWLQPLGEIFVLKQSSGDQNQTTKVIFSDFRKIDLILITKTRIIENKPFWTKQKIIFSNSGEIKHLLQEKALLTNSYDPSSYDLKKLANDFWFTSFTVINKIIRNDLLIALHLTLDLYKSCLLLGMWLRDKETGTYIHRTGGVRNDLLEQMDIKIEDLSKVGMLTLVEKCGQEFDKLALEWSIDYAPYSPIFKNALDQARKDIGV